MFRGVFACPPTLPKLVGSLTSESGAPKTAIKNIEKLRAELHVEGLADLGYVRPLNDAQVFIQESKSPHIRLVRTHVSEGKGHRLRKGSDVQVRVSGGVKLPP